MGTQKRYKPDLEKRWIALRREKVRKVKRQQKQIITLRKDAYRSMRRMEHAST